MEASSPKYQDQASKQEAFTYYRPHSQNFTTSTQTSTRVLPSENGEFDEASGELQSVVVMDDFDVEKELHRAQKDGTNAFKVLSMCFYERTKARLANKKNVPIPELQERQSPIQNTLLKTSSSPKGYAQLAQRSPRAIQAKMLTNLQNVREVVENKNLQSPREQKKTTQPIKPQTAGQKSLKVGLANNCGMPNDPLKSPKSKVSTKETHIVKEDKHIAKERPTLKLENETPAFYFSILKQKYSSPQTRLGTDYAAESPKQVFEETRRGTIDTSRSSATPLTKLFDLKDQIRQLRDMKNGKPANVAPKTARNMPQKELLINNFTEGHISKNFRDSSESSISKGLRGYVHGRGTIESPRMHTERTFDLATPVLTELHEEDGHFQMKKSTYQSKKTVETKKQENGKTKVVKEKHNEQLNGRVVNAQIKNSESVKNLGRVGQTDQARNIRKEVEEKLKMKVSGDNSRGWIGERKDNYHSSALGKSSECKRFSIEPVDLQKSGGYAAQAKFRLNLDGLGKERCETEPDTLSLREYLSRSQKQGGSKTKR